MNRLLQRSFAAIALFSALITAQATAQTCPFDNGGSSLEVDGLILTRYALGLTGAPLVANTGISAVDAPTVEASINCPSCGLNITGNPTMTVADATIISRKLAGFSGAALTNNLGLGDGTRNTPAAVQSFLLAGCGATGGTVTNIATSNGILGGPITATGTLSADTTFLQRRVATGCAVGSFITSIAVDGTPTCGTPAGSAGGTVTNVATGSGLTGGPITSTGTINLTANQLLPTTACTSGQVPKWNGSAWACAADDAGPANAFVQGGNTFALGAGVASVLGNTDNRPLTLRAPQSTIKLLVDPANGDDGLRISFGMSGPNLAPNTINGSRANSVAAGVYGATIGGGGSVITGAGEEPNQVNARFGTVSGGTVNSVTSANGAVGGGNTNRVTSESGTVGGGFNNRAGSGSDAQSVPTVGGGESNVASGTASTVPGGSNNRAAGNYSLAAGLKAKADHNGAFVWGDSTLADVTSTGNDQFVIRAKGGIRLPGAGVNQPGTGTPKSGTNMFTHQVPVAGPCQASGQGTMFTAIDHPLTNNNPAAILVVTPSIGDFAVATQLAYKFPVAVYFESRAPQAGVFCPQGRWVIYNAQFETVTAPMLTEHKFNVFVINP